VLAEVWRRGRPPTPSIEAVTTHSVEALRAYLDGEEASIAGRQKDAQAAYARAIAIDSTFWYAYFRAAAALGWYEGEADTAIVRAYRTHADRLPRRERLLVQAWSWDSGFIWQQARLEELVREYPDYWPAWFALGDNYVHYYPYVGFSRADARRALERAVALNPRLVFAWGHLVWMYQADRDTAAAARALDALGRLGADATFREIVGSDAMLVWRTIQALQTGSSTGQDLVDSLYASSKAALASGMGLPYVHPFALKVASPATQIRFNRRLLSHGVPPAEADQLLLFTALLWASRGAWDSALVTMAERAAGKPEDSPALWSYRLAVLGTWLGALPPGQARARRAAAVNAVAAVPGQLGVLLRSDLAWLDGIDAVARQDTVGLATARAAVRAAGDTSARRASLLDLSPFEMALRGNRRAAAARLASLEWQSADSNPWAATGVFPLGRAVRRTAAAGWLLEAGDTAQAARLLMYHGAVSGPFAEKIVMGPLLTLQLARIEEAKGLFPEARRDYEAFLAVYDLPSPAHRHLVDEAREALARLRGQRGPRQPASEGGRGTSAIGGEPGS
jgi:hypothetical protein